MLPRVAIVYLCYNNRKYLPEVFDSLRALDYPSERLELVIVDNDSKDGSREWLQEQTGVTFFPNKKNTGFAEGNNLGIQHALQGGADYVYLLNGDAKLDPSAITRAVELAESDTRIGAVQSRIMLWNNPDVINATGGMVHFLGFGFVRDNGRAWSHTKSQVEDGQDIAYASGAAVLYRGSVLQEVGVLDPFLFLYHEDLELGWRIRLAGYRNVLAVNSVAYHDYEFSRSVQKFYWMERNRVLVHLSHLRLRTLLLLSPFLLLSEIGLLAFAIKGGWVKEKGRVYLDLLNPRTWRYVVRKRRERVAVRRVSDQEIVRHWTGKIEHQETDQPVVTLIINPVLSLIWSILKRFIV